MGIVLARLFGDKEVPVLVLGLGGAGKTAIINWLIGRDEVVYTPATVGLHLETVQYNKTKFAFWEMGGQISIRPFLRGFFRNTRAMIFVVDSSDKERLSNAKEELHGILEEEEVKESIVLVFSNKQDLPEALDNAVITEALELCKIKNRHWAIFKTCAIKGEGIFQGLDWLSNTLQCGG